MPWGGCRCPSPKLKPRLSVCLNCADLSPTTLLTLAMKSPERLKNWKWPEWLILPKLKFWTTLACQGSAVSKLRSTPTTAFKRASLLLTKVNVLVWLAIRLVWLTTGINGELLSHAPSYKWTDVKLLRLKQWKRTAWTLFNLESAADTPIKLPSLRLVTSWSTTFLPSNTWLSSPSPPKPSFPLATAWGLDTSPLDSLLTCKVLPKVKVSRELWKGGISLVRELPMESVKLTESPVLLVTVNSPVKFSRERWWRDTWETTAPLSWTRESLK